MIKNHSQAYPGRLYHRILSTLAIGLGLGGILVLAGIGSLVFGARSVSLEEVFGAFQDNQRVDIGAVVVQRRFVRTIFALVLGASLGVSGALMKAVTRNPIADPSVLGVNTGAALFVVWGIAFLGISTARQYVSLALLGAGITAILVYGIGSLGRDGATPVKLALAGTAVSAALSSLISTILLPRNNVMNDFRFWQVGSVGGASWEALGILIPWIGAALLVGFLSAPSLNGLALGDEAAASLGIKVGRTRMINACTGVVLCGVTTAFAGPIGFIGLMASHLVQLLVGPDQRKVLPLSAFTGGLLLLIADILGRLIVRPRELEVGIVTAFIGAPLLIFIATKSKVHHV